MITPISANVHTAYQDLIDKHGRKPSPKIIGSLIKVEKAGKGYWVSRRRRGGKVEERSIGPDTEQIRAIVDDARAENDKLKAWNRESSSSVAMLKSAGCLAPDVTTGRVFTALSEAGFFEQGGMIGGTHAFRCYPLMLGYKPTADHSYTEDIDLMIPRRLAVIAPQETGLIKKLVKLGLKIEPLGGVSDKKPLSWLVDDRLTLDILAPVQRGGALTAEIKEFGLVAQSLKYLEYSLKSPVKAVSLYRAGVLLTVPKPARFAIHKLIVAMLREGNTLGKSQKDLRQAEWLIQILSKDQPFELFEAWEDVVARGPSWKKLAFAGLSKIDSAKEHMQGVAQEFGDESIVPE